VKLASGVRLGPYEIVAPIGAGGMGEVYRARDTRLDRTVAIKILPADFAQDAKLRIRFEREAKTISSLNHPHICALYDVGPEYLVMEHCEGKTLAQRIADGPLPIQQALDYGIQIADALDKAHRQGIIHRDLKPSNIMLTKSGVKLLDFGLAKQRLDSSPDQSTVQQVTEEGKILGTVQYMAPELFHGKEADARSDIFALGLVLYEMITGKPAFSAPSKASLIAAILEHPTPPSDAPPPLDRLIRACLTKDPDERIQTAHDVLFELRWIVDGLPLPAAARTTRRITALPWIAGAAVMLIVITVGTWRSTDRRNGIPSVTRTSINLPLPVAESVNRDMFAISPDAKKLAYTALRSDGKWQIYMRPFDQPEAMPISGTEEGYSPFFSPDGQWLGFATKGKLKKLPVAGGTALTICDANHVRGAAWGPNDTIIFATFDSPLLRVSADGGSPQPVTRVKGEWIHRYPTFLPDGRHVLYTELDGAQLGLAADQSRNVAVVDLKNGKTRVVMPASWYGRYSPTGHLLFVRSGVLFAAPFDAKQNEVTGPSVPLLNDVLTYPPSATAFFNISTNGTLAYLPKFPPPYQDLVFMDRKGNVQPIVGTRPFGGARISPDGQRIAVDIIGSDRRDVWVYQIGRGSWTQLTSEADNLVGTWSPDGRQILFRSNRKPPYNEYLISADGAGAAKQITSRRQFVGSATWSGRTLVFDTQVAKTGYDIWTMNIDDEKSAKPLLDSAFNEGFPSLSPDGHWLAYISDRSGRGDMKSDEVYVQPYPGPGPAWPISTDGGKGIPKWSKDGRKLYYRKGDKLMEVDVQTTPSFAAGKPRLLFETPFAAFDVAPDGRFLLVRDKEKPKPLTEIKVVQGLLTPTKHWLW